MKPTRRKHDEITKNTTREELLYNVRGIKSRRDRALASFLYITGCRISEVLGKTKVIPIYEGKGEERIKVSQKIIEIEPLRRENIEFHSEDIILVNNVPCLKWRHKVQRRNIPLKISSDGDFINIFLEHYNTLSEGSPLFDMSRRWAWEIINRELGVYPHFLIHQRCTELVSKRGFTDLYLKKLRGWRDTRPAEVYAHLNWQDVAEKL